MTDKRQVGYDRLAPWYEFLETLRFGGTLQRARVALIPQLTDRCSTSSSRVLFLGDGDGRLLEVFVAAFPSAEVTSFDISPRMLDLQRERLKCKGQEHHVSWECGDVELLDFPSNQFDVVVTAFFLDCFDEIQLTRILPRIVHSLKSAGHWYFVDFQLPVRGLKRRWASFWLAIMHAFFAWQTGLESRHLVDPEPQLRALGLESIAKQTFQFEMIRSAIYQRVDD